MTDKTNSTPNEAVIVRRYAPGDRAAVWALCCDTADGGKPLDERFFDRQWAVDCIIRYYTDYEPESCWVAEINGQVVGYLTAAMDYHKQHRIFQRRILPVAMLRAFFRGILFRAESWRMLRVLSRNVEPHRKRLLVSSQGYPATLHINLAQTSRHHGVGHLLMTSHLTHLQSLRVPGVHASVRADNVDGCTFFQSVGFTPVTNYETVFPSANGAQVVRTILFGRRVHEPA